MEEKWIQDLNTLTTPGNLGFYSFGNVTQIVLFDKNSKESWNYFTNITFSKKNTPKDNSEFITSKPISVTENLKLAISTYTISIEVFKNLYITATQEQVWKFTDDKIRVPLNLDSVFSTTKKFIPHNYPSSRQHQEAVPLELSLYGSNFHGNYYILELYSTKEKINTLVTEKEKAKIQSIIKEHHLTYDLINLFDRVGNIVCKFEAELIKAKPLALGNKGIKYKFSLSEHQKSSKNFIIQIIQEHDHLIYENENYIIQLNPGESKECGIEPNQCKNIITILDNETGLIQFMTVNDHSICSNYYSQISPENFLVQGKTNFRTFKINKIELKLPLKDIRGIGTIYLEREMNEAEKRQQRWIDSFFASQNYFKIYTQNSHTAAINDIRKILNNSLLWDLKEIWLIDPYLMPNDILETVLFCEKPNINIKCLTDFSSILSNNQTKNMLKQEPEENQQNETKFNALKRQCQKELSDSISEDTDITLSYRTIANNYGTSFHDRYLILKYNINKTRVWSLGISVNSLGNKHHIIQIVEAPELIANMFKNIWDETNQDICKIYEIPS